MTAVSPVAAAEHTHIWGQYKICDIEVSVKVSSTPSPPPRPRQGNEDTGTGPGGGVGEQVTHILGAGSCHFQECRIPGFLGQGLMGSEAQMLVTQDGLSWGRSKL